MDTKTPVLCPVDFSDASRSALRLAAAVAAYFETTLLVVTVDDPLLAEVAAQATPSLKDETERELHRFCRDTLAAAVPPAERLRYLVAIGKPAPEILRVGQENNAGIIVMSSQGRSGARKMFFGSTAERVLRETTVPVLVTRDDRAAPAGVKEFAQHVNRLVVPVDLSETSREQVRIAGAIADTLSVPMLLVHVLEAVFVPYNVRLAVGGVGLAQGGVDAMRRERAGEQLTELAAEVTGGATETLVITGEPAEEITKIAATRGANLIVIGLHSAGTFGPRMGSVTYRVLSLTHALVLALPPAAALTR